MPLKLELQPTNKCNLKCKQCWMKGYDPKDFRYDLELPPERYLEIIREAAKLGVLHIEFTGGGEPTFDQEAIMSYFREIKRLGIFGDITTNGTRFTDDMIRETVELRWDRLSFSMDGANAKTHDFIREQRGAFEKSIHAIKRFTYWKKELGQEKPLLEMVPVLTNRNYHQMSEYLELAHEIGIQRVKMKPLYVHHQFAEQLRLNEEQLTEMNKHIEEALPIANELGIETNFSDLIHRPGNQVVKKAVTIIDLYDEELEGFRENLAEALHLKVEDFYTKESSEVYERFIKFVQIPCFLPWHHITISPDGGVIPCTGAGTMEPKPNVRDHSLNEILFGEQFTEFRSQVASGKMPTICQECCVGLFLDNRRFREELVNIGQPQLKHDAESLKKKKRYKRKIKSLIQVFRR